MGLRNSRISVARNSRISTAQPATPHAIPAAPKGNAYAQQEIAPVISIAPALDMRAEAEELSQFDVEARAQIAFWDAVMGVE